MADKKAVRLKPQQNLTDGQRIGLSRLMRKNSDPAIIRRRGAAR